MYKIYTKYIYKIDKIDSKEIIADYFYIIVL